MDDALVRGRDAFRRRAWASARELLDSACQDRPDDGAALDLLGAAAFLAGDDDASARAWERAHLAYLRCGDAAAAAGCGFWLGLTLMLRGRGSAAAGWFARTARVIDESGAECAASGWLLVPSAMAALAEGDAARALGHYDDAERIGREFSDVDLGAIAHLGRGEALLALGETATGLALLDEAMVAVTTGELSAITAGIVYCAVIEACMKVFDLRRATEWTDALSLWCDAQPDLVPYRGHCLVHRSQILTASGDWSEAAAAAALAARTFAQPPHPALGLALYQQAELHRLQGDFEDADRSYRLAHGAGCPPEPGLALLRLAEGRIDAAVSGITRSLAADHEPLARPLFLSAFVEIMVAAGDPDAAAGTAETLSGIAAEHDAPLLRALAGSAEGAVLIARGDAAAALPILQRACATWRSLGMPYQVAHTTELCGRAWRAVGDEDAAAMEFGSAEAAFERLGALPDRDRVQALAGRREAPATITERECDVLRLVAKGKTNREIGAELIISEHTVARHLQNTFTKLGISSRAAATAYAYEHGIV